MGRDAAGPILPAASLLAAPGGLAQTHRPAAHSPGGVPHLLPGLRRAETATTTAEGPQLGTVLLAPALGQSGQPGHNPSVEPTTQLALLGMGAPPAAVVLAMASAGPPSGRAVLPAAGASSAHQFPPDVLGELVSPSAFSPCPWPQCQSTRQGSQGVGAHTSSEMATASMARLLSLAGHSPARPLTRRRHQPVPSHRKAQGRITPPPTPSQLSQLLARGQRLQRPPEPSSSPIPVSSRISHRSN